MDNREQKRTKAVKKVLGVGKRTPNESALMATVLVLGCDLSDGPDFWDHYIASLEIGFFAHPREKV